MTKKDLMKDLITRINFINQKLELKDLMFRLELDLNGFNIYKSLYDDDYKNIGKLTIHYGKSLSATKQFLQGFVWGLD